MRLAAAAQVHGRSKRQIMYRKSYAVAFSLALFWAAGTVGCAQKADLVSQDSGGRGEGLDSGSLDGGQDVSRRDAGPQDGGPGDGGWARGNMDEWRHFFGLTWVGTPENKLRFAKNMGYQYVEAHSSAYKNLADAENLKFYLADPWNHTYSFDLNLSNYTSTERTEFESIGVWKSTEVFPANIATGWFLQSTGNTFIVNLDFQQQAVIDSTVEKIVALAKSWQNERGFTFAGIMVDVPTLTGDFWSGPQGSGGRQVALSYWTGGAESCAAPTSRHTHNYPTYTEGSAAFFKKLFQRTREVFPGAKFMIEPWEPYAWLDSIKNRQDRMDLTPVDVLVSQEAPGTQFVDDIRVYNNPALVGLLPRERAGSSQPDRSGESDNRLYAAKAAMNGAWYNWFGPIRFGAQGDAVGPKYTDISEVPARLKLVRVIAGWDNIAGVDLRNRAWDGTTYRSPNSFISSDIIYSRRPDTRELYVVFMTRQGQVQLRSGERVASVQRVDNLFGKLGNALADVTADQETIRLNSSAALPGNGSGVGYIITLVP